MCQDSKAFQKVSLVAAGALALALLTTCGGADQAGGLRVSGPVVQLADEEKAQSHHVITPPRRSGGDAQDGGPMMAATVGPSPLAQKQPEPPNQRPPVPLPIEVVSREKKCLSTVWKIVTRFPLIFGWFLPDCWDASQAVLSRIETFDT